MGRILHNDKRTDDCTGKTARYQTGWSGRDLETDDGKVPASGDGIEGEDFLRDSPTGRGSGSGDKGWLTCNAHPLEVTLSGRGLGISPH